MKKFSMTCCALVALTIAAPAFAGSPGNDRLVPIPAAQTAKEGNLIGDGKNTPREFIPGKAPAQRIKELNKWMIERGGKYSGRKCDPKQKRCVEMVTLPLTDGSTLILGFYDHFDSKQDYYTYCRKDPTDSTMACYDMLAGKYYANMKDSVTGKWETIYDQAQEEQKQDNKTETTDYDLL